MNENEKRKKIENILIHIVKIDNKNNVKKIFCNQKNSSSWNT